ncbi:tetratricopeptide repeat protein [Spartinivicinus poritis]|uniref:Tetratricopeptide repeat protein n=1 Tax=Spartinivicinus poritis TaxID=2994640 RepID=A0ABT5U9Q2_9GAMM|nr:tetratricopeptide repeat protein [Spartinivicinus sp. A2-2]MDE1462193.1 tetratricopeptide repeat protein [Spartinivicinus sp. A2-2]
MRIDALFDIGKYDEAEKQIRQQLTQDPEDAYWLLNLGRVLMCQENYQAAEEALLKSLGFNPDFGGAYYLLSFTSHCLSKFTLELDYAKKAAEIDPEDPDFLQRLAKAHLQNGEIKQAHTILQQVIKLEPDSEEAFRLLGDIELEQEKYAAAEHAYREALKYDPEDISLLNGFARSLIAQKRKLRDAIDVLYNIVQLDPTNKVITQNLYFAIREWIDKNTIKGKRKSALTDLPEPLQLFYKDYKQRSSIFEAWGKYSWGLAWFGALALMTYLFSLIEKT